MILICLFFRSSTLAPTFVDKKTHPYKSSEVLIWNEKLVKVLSIYNSSQENFPEKLVQLIDEYAITHVVIDKNRNDLIIPNKKPEFEDLYYRVYKL